MHRILVASCCLALLACTPAEGDAKGGAKKSEPAKSEPAKTEPAKTEPAKTEPAKTEPALPPSEVIGLMQTKAGLSLQVHTGGCRKASDVTFGVEAGTLKVTAIVPDSCEMDSVLGVDFLYPWADLPAFMMIGIELGAAEVVKPGSKAGPSVPPEGAKDERLFGVELTDDGIDVRVFSGGCTDAAHFTFYVEPGEVQTLHIVRTKADLCEAYVAEGELLHFTWEQLGVTGKQVRVANPFEKLIVK
jgi:hypothetical protein